MHITQKIQSKKIVKGGLIATNLGRTQGTTSRAIFCCLVITEPMEDFICLVSASASQFFRQTQIYSIFSVLMSLTAALRDFKKARKGSSMFEKDNEFKNQVTTFQTCFKSGILIGLD